MYNPSKISYLSGNGNQFSFEDLSNAFSQSQEFAEKVKQFTSDLRDAVSNILTRGSTPSKVDSNQNMSYEELLAQFCDLKKLGKFDEIESFLYSLKVSGQQNLASQLEKGINNCPSSGALQTIYIPSLPLNPLVTPTPTSPTIFDNDEEEESKFQDNLIKFGIPIVGISLFYFLFMKKKKKR